MKVKGYSEFEKDPVTGAIINTDKNAYEKALKAAELRKQQSNKIEALETEMAEIKKLLIDISQRIN